MPTYVYECRSCSDVFEVEQRITEDALQDCGCGATNSLRRLIQPVGIAFKGAGFYSNDNVAKVASPDCSGDPSACACSQNDVAQEKLPVAN